MAHGEVTKNAKDRHVIFFSWSGELSKVVATIFKNFITELLPEKADSIYMSDHIPAGEEWLPNLHNTIQHTCYSAIVFLTNENLESVWINYETGMLKPFATTIATVYIDVNDVTVRNRNLPLSMLQAFSLLKKEQREENLWDSLLSSVFPFEANTDHFIATRRESCIKKAPDFFHEVDTILEDYRTKALPNNWLGNVKYNLHMSDSNFIMPDIFTQYKHELFLAGVVHGFVLDLVRNKSKFKLMIDSLLQDRSRKVKILVSDLWDENLKNCYLNMDVGGAMRLSLNNVTKSLIDKESPSYISSVIKREYSQEIYDDIVSNERLIIRKIKLLPDTFWFVDSDEKSKTGNGMILLQTAINGKDRPSFYFNRSEHNELFSYYYDMCSSAFDTFSEPIFPL